MKISLDEYDKVRAMIPGLFQFNENEMFTQAALAVTDDELFFYDDNAPTHIMGDVYHYALKKRVKLDDIMMVIDEKITHNKQLNTMGRLNFVMEDEDESLIFYYYLTDKGDVTSFLKELSSVGIKAKKRAVDLSPDKL